MIKVREWHRRVEDWCAAVSGTIIFAMMILSSIDIFGRYVLNSPIPSTYELLELSLPVAAYLSFAYVQRSKGHITIEFLIERLRPGVAARLNAIVLALMLGISALITWRTALEAVASFHVGEYTFGLIKYPLGPSRAFVTFGVGLLCLRLIADFFGQIGKHPPKEEEEGERKEIIHGT